MTGVQTCALPILGDKVSGEEKAKVEEEVSNVKKALETNNTETIKDATDKLTKVFYALSEKLYGEKAAAAGAEGNANSEEAGSTTTDENGNVYNADYEVENDDNKNND